MSDEAAQVIAKWIHYSWDGLQDGRIGDRGFPIWIHSSYGGFQFQGGKQDLRDIAADIAKAERDDILARLREPDEAMRRRFRELHVSEDAFAAVADALEESLRGGE